MWLAYRGVTVLLLAPLMGALAVLLSGEARWLLPLYTDTFMSALGSYVLQYLPLFLLGALFGRLMADSGAASTLARWIVRTLGERHAMLTVVLACALLTYGGVSLFVVVFAVYPFAAELFRQSDIPKRLIPGTIALGAFTFTMDALPGTPQIQNIIPTGFFGTDTWAAPVLGTIGGLFILALGMSYLEWRRRVAQRAGEGYGTELKNEPAPFAGDKLANPWIALLPLVLVGVSNKIYTMLIPQYYGESHSFEPSVIGNAAPVVQEVSRVAAIWAVEAALLTGILAVLVLAWKAVSTHFAQSTQPAIAGALLASMNTASEYGFGAVIAALPGFLVVAGALGSIPNPLINEAITVTALAGITGSASGGMSIALAAMSETFIANANAANIPMDVLHRVASMASGGMDTLPHNGAVITLLAVTGLTHRQAYKDIFAITIIKTLAVFFIIGVFYATGWV
jgi:H+/gluconate symporter-like permease